MNRMSKSLTYFNASCSCCSLTPHLFHGILVLLAGSRVSDVGKWNLSQVVLSILSPPLSPKGVQVTEQWMGEQKAKRGSGRLQEQEFWGWCCQFIEWLLGQGEKSLVCSNRRTNGAGRAKGLDKTKKSKQLCGRRKMDKGDVSMYIHCFLCAVLFKWNYCKGMSF